MRVKLVSQHQQLRFVGEGFRTQALLFFFLQQLIVLDEEIQAAPEQHQGKGATEQAVQQIAGTGITQIEYFTEGQQCDEILQRLP